MVILDPAAIQPRLVRLITDVDNKINQHKANLSQLVVVGDDLHKTLAKKRKQDPRVKTPTLAANSPQVIKWLQQEARLNDVERDVADFINMVVDYGKCREMADLQNLAVAIQREYNPAAATRSAFLTWLSQPTALTRWAREKRLTDSVALSNQIKLLNTLAEAVGKKHDNLVKIAVRIKGLIGSV